MMASVSESSVKQYESGLKKWWKFCKTIEVDTYDLNIPRVMEFLWDQFETELLVGTLNSYRSAIALLQ